MKDNTNRTLTRGFKASKGTQTFDLVTKIHDDGFYIITVEKDLASGKSDTQQVSRSTQKKAQTYIDKLKESLNKKAYQVNDLKEKPHKVIFDAKLQKFKVSI